MQKSQQTSKEGNLNNIKPISQKKSSWKKGKMILMKKKIILRNQTLYQGKKNWN